MSRRKNRDPDGSVKKIKWRKTGFNGNHVRFLFLVVFEYPGKKTISREVLFIFLKENTSTPFLVFFSQFSSLRGEK